MLSLLLVFAGCAGGEEPGATPPAENDPAAQPPPTTTDAPGNVATTIRLEIAGGPEEGAYEATSERVTCSDGAAGANVWGNQYFEPDEEGLKSLQLIVPDAQNAESGATVFNLGVDVGGERYRIETRPDFPSRGNGTVTVDRAASPAVVEIDARTADGVALRGTITCHEVLRP